MINLSCWLLNRNPLFFFLETLHQLFGISILTSHNVTDAKIGQHYSSNTKKIIHLSSNKRFVISNCITILVFLHEENMGDIELPSLVFTAKLSTLSKDFFYHCVVLKIPIGLCLHHKYWNILVQSSIILLESGINSF